MTPTAATFDRLLQPLGSDAFLETYWPERAVGFKPARERLALFPTLASSAIREVVGGHAAPIHSVSSDDTDGALERVVNGEAAVAAFDAGRSLCLAGIHTLFPEVAAVLDSVTAALNMPIGSTQCNCYVSPAGEGVPWHFDDREVFVVHLQGSKIWTLARNVDLEYPTSNLVLATGGPDPSDEMSLYAPLQLVGPPADGRSVVDLKPGGAVFLPRGTWHATSAPEASLSLTFGLFTMTPLEVLLDAVRRDCVRDSRFRRPVPLATPRQRSRSQVELEALFGGWRESVARG